MPPTTPKANQPKPAHNAPQLLRTMGLFSLVVYGVGDMVGAGIYGTVGKAAGLMGNAVWLAFVVSMIAAMLTGLSYACLASRYPRAAGAAYVTHHAFGFAFLSYLIGLAVAASGLTSMATQTNVFADSLQSLVGGPRSWLILAFLAVMTFINWWGIRESMFANLICTAVEVSGLLFIIAIGVRYWGSVNYLETPGATFDVQGQILDHGLGVPLLLTGAVLTFYAFIGFEDMLNIAEEVKDPRRTMPRGIVIAQCVAALLYMGVAITAVSVVDYHDLAAPGAPLTKIANRAAPWLPAQTFNFITMFAVANTMLINYVMGSRLLYGMARQGLVPAILGRVHAARKTPHIAILTLLAIVAGLSYLGDVIHYTQEHASGWLQTVAASLSRPDPISNLASATSLLLLFSFIVVNGGLIRLKLRRGEPTGAFEVPIAIPLLGMLVNAALIASRLADPNAGLLAPIIAAVMVAGITLLYFLFRPKNVTEEALAAIESES